MQKHPPEVPGVVPQILGVVAPLHRPALGLRVLRLRVPHPDDVRVKPRRQRRLHHANVRRVGIGDAAAAPVASDRARVLPLHEPEVGEDRRVLDPTRAHRLQSLLTEKTLVAVPPLARAPALALRPDPALVRRRRGEVIAPVRVELSLRRVRRVPGVLRGEEQRPTAHRRRDREYRVEAPEKRAVEEHLADARVRRHAREVPPERREPFLRVERAEVSQLRQRGVHRRAVRRGERGGERRRHGLVGTHRFDAQTQLLQRRSEHLGRLRRRHGREPGAGEHGEARAGRDSARAAPALLRGGAGNPRVGERGHASARVPAHLLRAAGVDDIPHVVDRHRGFRDVRGDDDLAHAGRGPLENFTLVLPAERAVERQHQKRPSVQKPGLLELPNQLGDLELAGHEHEHRAQSEIRFLRLLARDRGRRERGGALQLLRLDDARDEPLDGVVVDDRVVDDGDGPLRLRRVVVGERARRLGERVVHATLRIGEQSPTRGTEGADGGGAALIEERGTRV